MITTLVIFWDYEIAHGNPDIQPNQYTKWEVFFGNPFSIFTSVRFEGGIPNRFPSNPKACAL